MGNMTSTMNSILPTLQTAVNVASGINTLVQTTRGRGDGALDDLKATQAERLRAQKQKAALQKATIQANTQAAARDRQNALRRAVARQRAQFGGQGISTDNGSGQAILLGLFNESEQDAADRARLDQLKTTALDQNIDQTKRLNVLQASQLAEKENIGRLF